MKHQKESLMKALKNEITKAKEDLVERIEEKEDNSA